MRPGLRLEIWQNARMSTRNPYVLKPFSDCHTSCYETISRKNDAQTLGVAEARSNTNIYWCTPCVVVTCDLIKPTRGNYMLFNLLFMVFGRI